MLEFSSAMLFALTQYPYSRHYNVLNLDIAFQHTFNLGMLLFVFICYILCYLKTLVHNVLPHLFEEMHWLTYMTGDIAVSHWVKLAGWNHVLAVSAKCDGSRCHLPCTSHAWLNRSMGKNRCVAKLVLSSINLYVSVFTTFYFVLSFYCIAFSALTLLFGQKEGHLACKNWVVECWRGCLSGVRCRLAYGPADATLSCFSKIQFGFTFLVPAYLGVCVCVHVCIWFLLQSNLSKWITQPAEMDIICLIPFGHNVKYKTWISGYSASVNTHNEVPVLFT